MNKGSNALATFVRKYARGPTDRVAAVLASYGVHPDLITILGLILVVVGSLFLATGEFLVGGILLAISLPLDALDGAVARAMNRADAFGMVLDSTLDRYADGFILGAFGYYFAGHDRMDIVALALLTIVGSFATSYIRARADDSNVGVSVTVGWFTRLERAIIILVITFAAVARGDSASLEIGLLVLAIGTNLTAFQRLRFVYAALKDKGD